MVGPNIESVQIIVEPTSQLPKIHGKENSLTDVEALDTHLTSKEQNLKDTDHMNPTFRKKPIKQFYVRKRRKNVRPKS